VISGDDFNRLLGLLQELLHRHVHVAVMSARRQESHGDIWADFYGTLGISLEVAGEPDVRAFLVGYEQVVQDGDTLERVTTGSFRVDRDEVVGFGAPSVEHVVIEYADRLIAIGVAPPLDMPDVDDDG
jgi:hypothetical protein